MRHRRRAVSRTVAGASADLREATRATFLSFTANGFVFASWLSRIPQVKGQLRLGPSALGLVLLAGGIGAIAGLLLAGPAVARFGSRRTVAVMSVVSGTGLLATAVGYLFGTLPVMVGLVIFSFGQGGWDVAMNTHGTLVERRLGRSVLPRFHASYSVGTVAGALTGAAMAAARVPVSLHLGVVGVVVAGVVPFAVRGFLADQPAAGAASAPLQAWREPRTLLIGIFILMFAFAEGTGNDWISVALVGNYNATPAAGAAGVAVFLAAMTAGRWFGPAVIGRWGRVPAVGTLGLVAIAGVVLFCTGIGIPQALAGALLWGVGASLGFPVGLSAAGDEAGMAAARVSACSSIAYAAFLAGPSLIGFLGREVGVLRALASVAIFLAVAVVLVRVIRPLPGALTAQKPGSNSNQRGQ
jgi:predicted MFS family arabinose efflux permease